MTAEERKQFWQSVESGDAIDADNITPNQRGLIMSCCAQVSNLSDLMHAEMDHIAANQ